MRNTIRTTHKIINGDSRQMNLLANESVHLVITSGYEIKPEFILSDIRKVAPENGEQ
ncbi:MAG: hypothetical protein PH343_07870 [Nitrospira sp.]|nr:hypothetical protein [Nitrospira sp.]